MNDQLKQLSLAAWGTEWPEANSASLLALSADSAQELFTDLFDANHDDLYRHRLAAGVAGIPHLSPAAQAHLEAATERARQELFYFWWRHLHDADLLQADYEPVVTADLQVEHISRMLPLLAQNITPVSSAELFWPERRPLLARMAHKSVPVPILDAMLEVLVICKQRLAEMLAKAGSPSSVNTFTERDALGRYGPMQALLRTCRALRCMTKETQHRKDLLEAVLDFARADGHSGGISAVFQTMIEVWPEECDRPGVSLIVSDYQRRHSVSTHTVSQRIMPCFQNPEAAMSRTDAVLRALESDPTDVASAAMFERYCMAREASPDPSVLTRALAVLCMPNSTSGVRERLASSLRVMLQFITTDHIDRVISAIRVLKAFNDDRAGKDLMLVLKDAALRLDGTGMQAKRELILALFREEHESPSRLSEGMDIWLIATEIELMTTAPASLSDVDLDSKVRLALKPRAADATVATPFCLMDRLLVSQLHRAGVRVFQRKRVVTWSRVATLVQEMQTVSVPLPSSGNNSR
jgi:hypothetical protein